jgi:hypothetical protein
MRLLSISAWISPFVDKDTGLTALRMRWFLTRTGNSVMDDRAEFTLR